MMTLATQRQAYDRFKKSGQPISPSLFFETVEAFTEAIQKLNARLKEVEANPFDYQGTHEPGKTYGKNAVVTHGGSMWIAKCVTSQRPGDGPSWQLAVKAGRDAR